MDNFEEQVLKPVEEEMKKEKSEEKEVYVSKQGFEQARVMRGFTEIKSLYEFLRNNFYENKAFICGGYVRYMCSPRKKPEPASDVDIYVYDQEFFDPFKDRITSYFDLKLKHENEVSITYEGILDTERSLFACPPIQLIKPENKGAIVATGTMEEILENFDFTVIRAGLLNDTRALVDADFMHDEKLRLLRLKNIHCPVSSLLRCYKYARKGYFMRPIEALRLFSDWNNRDDEYRTKIIEFLTKSDSGNGLTQEEVDELESLMRID
ncbi:hypothetical protein M0R19_06180 [Candidatus Pacearchaeota archaeon]|nr:hypothetical protein [Candidatus Pacearchaeota archaeon]